MPPARTLPGPLVRHRGGPPQLEVPALERQLASLTLGQLPQVWVEIQSLTKTLASSMHLQLSLKETLGFSMYSQQRLVLLDRPQGCLEMRGTERPQLQGTSTWDERGLRGMSGISMRMALRGMMRARTSCRRSGGPSRAKTSRPSTTSRCWTCCRQSEAI
mmetsp:Transcript_119971/g.383041  ORF Transcript_119971/g.383041 Transcript_119971/m.383041 type:complete len:160 (+) Transcript_119971:1236-1715(+)